MMLLAAFIVALPFLSLPLVFGWIGIAFWACLFVPALLGIVVVQLPTKVAARRAGWSWGRSYLAVLVVNAALTMSLAWLLAGNPGFWGSVALISMALIAAAIWYALDDKALFGSSLRDMQGNFRA